MKTCASYSTICTGRNLEGNKTYDVLFVDTMNPIIIKFYKFKS